MNKQLNSRLNGSLRRSLRRSMWAVALCAGAASAQAEGLYIGGHIGTPDYHGRINGIDGKGSGAGVKLYGGYALNPYFGLELGGVDLGHIDDGNGRVKTKGGYLDAVGTYPLAPQWSLLGSVGAARARFDTTVGDDSSTGLKLGAGVQYDMSQRLALRAQYDRYRFNDAFGSSANVGQVSFGVKLGF